MSIPYTVNSYDVCVEGNERLRNNSEFILVAHITADSSLEDIHTQLREEVGACERFDGFDYRAAKRGVDKLVKDELAPLFAKRGNPWGLDHVHEDEDSGIRFFAYMQSPNI